MQERREQSPEISFLRGLPDDRLVRLFREAFPRHPASVLNDALARAFLGSFAQSGTFLVARDAATRETIGFAIGGDAEVLDRTRSQFIRAYGWRIAGSFLQGRLSARTLFARVSVRKPVPRSAHAPYQLRFIAVDPRAQGMGAGTMLLNAFEKTLPGGVAYHAWTLEGPHGAEAFYLARGFRRDVTLSGHVRMYKSL